MSQQPRELYDPRKDPSFMEQREISPSNPYDPGPRPPVDPPLAFPQQRERIGRVRLFFQKLFFGNTQPGTTAGARTAFKRGLIFAVLVALIIASPFVIVGLVKGMTAVAVALPALMFALACMFVAGAAMCTYACCVRYCNRRQRTTEYETHTRSSSFTSSTLVEQEVDDFANDGRLLSGSLEDGTTPYYTGQFKPTFGQPVPGYSLQQSTSGGNPSHATVFGGDEVRVNTYDL